jgi:hypothetical protein
MIWCVPSVGTSCGQKMHLVYSHAELIGTIPVCFQEFQPIRMIENRMVQEFQEKWRINLRSKISTKNSFSTSNLSFPHSTSHDDDLTEQNAEPSMIKHCEESELIEAMTMPMHLIQFASGVAVIR